MNCHHWRISRKYLSLRWVICQVTKALAGNFWFKNMSHNVDNFYLLSLLSPNCNEKKYKVVLYDVITGSDHLNINRELAQKIQEENELMPSLPEVRYCLRGCCLKNLCLWLLINIGLVSCWFFDLVFSKYFSKI